MSHSAKFNSVPTTQPAAEQKKKMANGLAVAAGAFARTDESIKVEYPPEEQLPSSEPVAGAGRAGANVFPTLATFSLQGKVGVVTGGARGLGLVMGRKYFDIRYRRSRANPTAEGMVISGADLALVDLNSMFTLFRHLLVSCMADMPHRGRSSPPGAIHSRDVPEGKPRRQKVCLSLFIDGYMYACVNSMHPRLPKVTAHYADVSDFESVESCIAEIVAEHGKIDNLVTSAGFTENFEAVSYPIDRMRKLWGVNVDGTYLFATSVARHLVSLFFQEDNPCSSTPGLGFGCLWARIYFLLTSQI